MGSVPGEQAYQLQMELSNVKARIGDLEKTLVNSVQQEQDAVPEKLDQHVGRESYPYVPDLDVQEENARRRSFSLTDLGKMKMGQSFTYVPKLDDKKRRRKVPHRMNKPHCGKQLSRSAWKTPIVFEPEAQFLRPLCKPPNRIARS